MSGIASMQAGRKYLVGDLLGYERVECLEVNPSFVMGGVDTYVVKVRYLESGIEDIFFEIPEAETNFYPRVEELVGE